MVGEIKRPWKHTCFVTGLVRHCARVGFAVVAQARAQTRVEDIDSRTDFSVDCLAEAKPCVVFTRRAMARCSEVDRVVALTHDDGYAVLAKIITLVPVAEYVGDTRLYAAFEFSATRVATMALFDWKNVYGYQMSWRSWAWQAHHFPAARKFWPRGGEAVPRPRP